MNLLTEPLGLLHESVKNQWNGGAAYMVLKFDSFDDYAAAYRFFKRKFDPRCFNTGSGVLPEIDLNRRGIEELAKLWNLNIEEQQEKTWEVLIPSRLEATIAYLLRADKK